MIGYKLTDQNMQTRNNFQWELNVAKTPETTENKKGLCNPGWLHFYVDPLIAVFMNPSHADIKNPRLFECLCEGEIIHESLKSGCKQMTLLKEISLPVITLEQRIKFGILCVLEVYQEEKFVNWAKKWLDGSDRSKEAAFAAYAAAAAYSVADAAYYAACAVAYAADRSALYSAYAYSAADAAAYSAHYAAYAAAYAAKAADNVGKAIDFVKLAQQALES